MLNKRPVSVPQDHWRRSNSPWITSYLEGQNGEYLVLVDDDFIMNTFNSYGLKNKVPAFNFAFELLRKGTCNFSRAQEYGLTKEDIEAQTELLYGLLHARYIMTKPGLQAMYTYWQEKRFPRCPRVFCKDAVCLPYGDSEEPGKSKVKMYCMCCGDVYNISEMKMDGAFFGPNWVHMFMTKYKAAIPRETKKVYVPKIFGFRIYHPPELEQEDLYSTDEDE